MLNSYNVDIKTVDRNTLKDINDVRIDPSLNKEERMQSYVDQIGNPYCYLDNNVVVKISYSETDATLEDRLRSYICSLD